MVERFVFPCDNFLRDSIGAARIDFHYDAIVRRDTGLPSSPEVFFIESICVSAKGKPENVHAHVWVHFIMGAEVLLNSLLEIDQVMQERLTEAAKQYYHTVISPEESKETSA